MKVRKLRKVRHAMIDNASWWAADNDTRMYFIRKVPRCRTYNVWCSDCNANRFRDDNRRFPFSIEEFNAFEERVQDAYTTYKGDEE